MRKRKTDEKREEKYDNDIVGKNKNCGVRYFLSNYMYLTFSASPSRRKRSAVIVECICMPVTRNRYIECD